MKTAEISDTCEMPLRRCCECGVVRSIEHFRFRDVAARRRHSICRDCNAAYQRQRKAKQVGKRLDRFASEIHRARDRGFNRVAAVINAMVREFGGMARLVEIWHGHIKAAEALDNHSLALKHMRCIIDILIVMAPIEEQRRRDFLNRATDEELQTAALRDLLRVLGNICERDPVQREVVREALGF